MDISRIECYILRIGQWHLHTWKFAESKRALSRLSIDTTPEVAAMFDSISCTATDGIHGILYPPFAKDVDCLFLT